MGFLHAARAVVGVSLCAAAIVGTGGVAQAVTPNGPDLEFILEQIKRSEAHAAGGKLVGTGPDQISSALLPYGLRTVNGQFNNLIPGQEQFGAADRLMPRLLAPTFVQAESFDPDGPGPAPASPPTSYAQKSGTVADTRPRTISNLIVDQTNGNPAAVSAAADTPGSGGPDAGGNLFIPNRAPDVGLSAPYNSWFTLFGQFFDHGLDLTTKGGSGTVIVPLKPDDPLYDPVSHTNFMVLTRATNERGPDGLIGTADDVHEHTNTTTPFVDQNQTYTSHPSHQVFLREYALDAGGHPVATGRLLDRAAGGGLPAWADVKTQARTLLGIELDDQDILDVPLLKTDRYGRFIADPATGFPQIVTTADPVAFASGTPGAPVDATLAVRTGHAFLDDIAHHAVPFGDHDNNPSTPRRALTPDPDTTTGEDNDPATYDDELLDKHFITGDGRGNENIGLTAVHHVFHEEHNLLVDDIKNLILEPGPPAPADWQLPNGAWSGERLFQAAKFMTEMEYQHIVFEEFARKVQPQVNVFAGYQTDIDPAIVSEFANTVYRFGHSMLNETVARKNADGATNDIGLIQAFLNPQSFDDDGKGGTLSPQQAAGSIVRGMTRQVGNEIDEFVTGALRNNLVGLPLDLATINLARGRDTGIPGLNAARRTFFAATSNSALRPYESWSDFKAGIRHPASLVNFIAAYGTHPSITAATTTAAKRAAGRLIVDGGTGAPGDRSDFLNSTGAWANDSDGVTKTGLDDVDFWVGGLAERQMPFGGLLGSTFNFVFETQMEKLQEADRFYYLSRTAGLNFLTQLEENSFAELVMRTTDAKHLPHAVFSRPDFLFEIANLGSGGPVADDPATPYDESHLLSRMLDGTVRFSGQEHIVMGGTGGADRMHAGIGDDTVWGDGGNDRIEGGAGNDALVGGAGNDIITDSFGIDILKGGAGDDAINAGPGAGDLILPGLGDDVVVGGADPKETFAGGGDDLVIAGDSSDTVLGDEGDDWLEGGDQADALQGDSGAPFQDGRTGNDVIRGDAGDDALAAEGGDDIMVNGPGIDSHEGMLGFDWAIHQGDPQAADADLNFTGFQPPSPTNIRDSFDLVEGLSGWNKDDILRGSSADKNRMVDHELDNPGLISGLSSVIGGAKKFTGGNIILGGGGSDILEGRGGDDIIDGDSWLSVRLSVRAANNTAVEIQSADSLKEIQAGVFAGSIRPNQIRVVREIKTAPAGTNVDTALFSDVRANYDISPIAGTAELTVVHARGTQDDGTDTLRNVERLTFTDETIEVQPLLTNTPATGTVTISDTTPAVGRALTVTRAFDDADGVNASTIVFAWQAETAPGAWATISSGTTFTPSLGQVGSRLRVVATFKDGDGVPESVTSAATAAVTRADDGSTEAPAPGLAAPAPAPLPGVALAGNAQPTASATPTVAVLGRPTFISAAGTAPMTVAVNVPTGGTVLQIRVFRLPRPAVGEAAARRAARGKLIATVYRATPEARRYMFRLTEKKLRRLTPGRYRVELRVGRTRGALGPASTRTVTVAGTSAPTGT
jgi:Ca2+-binding RTX toxin-like protein